MYISLLNNEKKDKVILIQQLIRPGLRATLYLNGMTKIGHISSLEITRWGTFLGHPVKLAPIPLAPSLQLTTYVTETVLWFFLNYVAWIAWTNRVNRYRELMKGYILEAFWKSPCLYVTHCIDLKIGTWLHYFSKSNIITRDENTLLPFEQH